MEKEITYLGKALEAPEKPFVAIIGGSKISGKIDVIDNLLDKVDTLVIVGGMAYTFQRALGVTTGKSLVEEDKIDMAKAALDKAKAKGVNLLLPVDNILADNFAPDAKTQPWDTSKNFPADWQGLDIGPKSIAAIEGRSSRRARTIVWNGPTGVFEFPALRRRHQRHRQRRRGQQGSHLHHRRRRLRLRHQPGRRRRPDHPHLHRRRRQPRIPRRQKTPRRRSPHQQVGTRSTADCLRRGFIDAGSRKSVPLVPRLWGPGEARVLRAALQSGIPSRSGRVLTQKFVAPHAPASIARKCPFPANSSSARSAVTKVAPKCRAVATRIRSAGSACISKGRRVLSTDVIKYLGRVLPRSGMDPAAAAALLEDLADRALASEFEPVACLEAPEPAEVPASVRRADGRSVYQRHGGIRYATRAQLAMEARMAAQASEGGAPRHDARAGRARARRGPGRLEAALAGRAHDTHDTRAARDTRAAAGCARTRPPPHWPR